MILENIFTTQTLSHKTRPHHPHLPPLEHPPILSAPREVKHGHIPDIREVLCQHPPSLHPVAAVCNTIKGNSNNPLFSLPTPSRFRTRLEVVRQEGYGIGKVEVEYEPALEKDEFNVEVSLERDQVIEQRLLSGRGEEEKEDEEEGTMGVRGCERGWRFVEGAVGELEC